MLVGVGATAINAYLAQESFRTGWSVAYRRAVARDVCVNYKRAVEAGC